MQNSAGQVLGNINEGSFEPLTDQQNMNQVNPAGQVPMGVAPNGTSLQPPNQIPATQPEQSDEFLGSVNGPEANNFVSMEDNPKYGTGSEMAKTALEGLGSGILSEPLNTAAEVASGTKPEDIIARREENPITHAASEAAGFLGSMVLETPFAKILSGIGNVGKSAVGLSGATGVAAKVASAGVGAAAEMAALQAAHEFTSDVILKDPNFSMDQAAINIGLSGILGLGTGVAVGTVSALWNATKESGLNGTLSLLQSKINGGVLPIGDEFQTFLKDAGEAGFNIPPEIRAGLSDSPEAQQLFKVLRESGSTPSEALKQVIESTKESAQDIMSNILGGENGPTKYEAGELAKTRLIQKAQELADVAEQKYQDIADVREVPINGEAAEKFYKRLLKKGEGFGAVGGPAQATFETFAERIKAQPTIGHLDDLVTEINDAMNKEFAGQGWKASQTYDALKEVKDSIRGFQDRQIGDAVAEVAKPRPSKSNVREMYNKTLEESGEAEFQKISDQIVKDREAARKGWHDYMTEMSDLASLTKTGRVQSADYFERTINEVPSEKVSERLFNKKNYAGLKSLKAEYPEIFDSLAAAQKREILESATRQPGTVKHTTIMNKVNSLPKEVKGLIFTKPELESLEASSSVIKRLNERINPSGTAGTMKQAMKHLLGGVGGLLGAMTGHGFIGGTIIGEIMGFLGGTGKDMGRLAILKAIGAEVPLEASSVKGSYDYMVNVMKGVKVFENGVKNTIRGGEIIPKYLMPNEKSRQSLEDALDSVTNKPSAIFDVGGNIKRVLPDHAAAAGLSAGAGVTYLQNLKPQTQILSPFEPEPPADKAAENRYNRALDIAQQPLLVLDHVKNSTLLPEDVQTISTIYPQLHAKMVQNLANEMIEAKHEGISIPYQKRLSLSLLMGQPLDATMTQPSMMRILASGHQNIATSDGAGVKKQQKPTAAAMKATEKVNSLYQTPLQSREANRRQG